MYSVIVNALHLINTHSSSINHIKLFFFTVFQYFLDLNFISIHINVNKVICMALLYFVRTLQNSLRLKQSHRRISTYTHVQNTLCEATSIKWQMQSRNRPVWKDWIKDSMSFGRNSKHYRFLDKLSRLVFFPRLKRSILAS